MVSKKRSKWQLVVYPLVGLLVANVLYQLLVSWHQINDIRHAQGILLLLAVINQLLAYVVIVPAMQGFYAKAGIGLTNWRTFGLVSTGLALAKIVPAGEYLLWRLSFRKHRGGASATTQWLIMYYLWMFGGLVLTFFVFELATLAIYPNATATTLVGKLRYVPIGLSLVFLAGLLATRLASVRRFLLRVTFDKLGSRAVSPRGIIRDRQLGGEELGALTFASLATWFIEAFTLYLCLSAVGLRVPLVIAMFGFAFARLFTFLPLVPGGIGEIEAGTVVFFAAYGFALGPVLTATVLYRLITYWPPLMIGAMSYVGMRRSPETADFDGRQLVTAVKLEL